MDMQQAVDCSLDVEPLVLATDFESTLSTITPNSQLAKSDPVCCESLARLSEQLALIPVLSRRQVEEVHQLMGVEGVVYIGNHGLGRWQKGYGYVESLATKYAPVIRGTLGQPRQELKLPALLLQDKGLTASVHYPSAQDLTAPRKPIASPLHDLAAEPGLKAVEGRRAVKLRPPLNLNEGTAVLELLRRYAVRGIVYAGDDETYLGAFRAIHRWARQEGNGALAVGVRSPEMPAGLGEEADLVV